MVEKKVKKNTGTIININLDTNKKKKKKNKKKSKNNKSDATIKKDILANYMMPNTSMFGGYSQPNLFNQAQRSFFPTIPQYIAPIAPVAPVAPKPNWEDEFKKILELQKNAYISALGGATLRTPSSTPSSSSSSSSSSTPSGPLLPTSSLDDKKSEAPLLSIDDSIQIEEMKSMEDAKNKLISSKASVAASEDDIEVEPGVKNRDIKPIIQEFNYNKKTYEVGVNKSRKVFVKISGSKDGWKYASQTFINTAPKFEWNRWINTNQKNFKLKL